MTDGTSAYQQDRLRDLLKVILPRNPFQKRRLSRFDPATIQLTDLPFTTKADLIADQAEHPPYGSNLTFPIDRYTRLHQTSGTSSGQPLRWLDTPENWEFLLDCWRTKFEPMGIRADDRIFFAFSFGPFLGFWCAFEAMSRAGYFCMTGGGMPTTARLRFLLEHRATIVCCTPTYALHLAQCALQEQIDLAASSVRMLIVAGEPGAGIRETRARIESAWGAQLFDHYGLTEVGPIAFEVAGEPQQMRILERHYIGEILQPDGSEPVLPGEVGELVVTNLGRVGSPLLRYRTGDLVRAVVAPPDGRLRLQGGILGRTDDMIHIRGNNVYPGAIEAVVRRFPEIVEFRLTVHERGSLTDLTLEIEPTAKANAQSLAEEVSRAIRDTLLFRVAVLPVAVGTLPRFEMKAKRIIRVREGVALGK